MIKHYQVGTRMSQAVVPWRPRLHRRAGRREPQGRARGPDARRSWRRSRRCCAEAGTDKSKLLAVNVFLPHISDFDAMNAVYDAWVDRRARRRPAPASRRASPTPTSGSRSRRSRRCRVERCTAASSTRLDLERDGKVLDVSEHSRSRSTARPISRSRCRSA